MWSKMDPSWTDIYQLGNNPLFRVYSSKFLRQSEHNWTEIKSLTDIYQLGNSSLFCVDFSKSWCKLKEKNSNPIFINSGMILCFEFCGLKNDGHETWHLYKYPRFADQKNKTKVFDIVCVVSIMITVFMNKQYLNT